MESASQSERRKVRILLIDGEHSIRSGVVSPLETLRELMQRVAHDQSSKNNEDSASERTAESNSVHIDEVLPCNYFDLIVGSGDGGWVAAMLGRLGMSASQALQAYTRIHSALHHSGNPLEPEERTSQFNLMLKDLIGTHSTSSNPEEPFQARQSKSNTHCRTILLTMASKNLAWPILIRTYRSRKHRFEDCSIRAAILAATAVPPLFEPCNINGQSYIAASQSGHCNPVETALSEAQAIFADGTVSCIISLGSGHPGHISLPSADFTSLAATAFKLSNDAEQKSQEVQSRLNVGEKIYFRFNVEQGMQEYQQADEQGYDSASAHTRAYCRTPDVDTALDAAVRSLLGKQAIASDIQPPNAVGPSSEVQQLFTLHINSKDPIQTYINELYKFNHGLPLWDPQPTCKVVEIGDVGIITEDGGFETFFNATVEAGKQPYRVPPKFKPLKLRPENFTTVEDAIQRPYLTSGEMKVQATGLQNQHTIDDPIQTFRMSFEISNGAVLILKDQVTRFLFPARPRVRKYIQSNYASWFRFCQSPHGLDRDLEGQDLIFVTGIYRGSDWSLGAWSNVGFRTDLSYAGLATFDEGRPCKLTGKWTPSLADGLHDGPSRARPKPRYFPLRSQLGDPSQEQCLFIRGYKISLRDVRRFPQMPAPSVPDNDVSVQQKRSWWKAMKKAARMGIPAVMRGAAGPKDLPPPPPPPSAGGAIQATGAVNLYSSPRVSVEEMGGRPPQHPLGHWSDLIFERFPGVEVTIVHDDDYPQDVNQGSLPIEQSGHFGFLSSPSHEPARVVTFTGTAAAESYLSTSASRAHSQFKDSTTVVPNRLELQIVPTVDSPPRPTKGTSKVVVIPANNPLEDMSERSRRGPSSLTIPPAPKQSAFPLDVLPLRRPSVESVPEVDPVLSDPNQIRKVSSSRVGSSTHRSRSPSPSEYPGHYYPESDVESLTRFSQGSSFSAGDPASSSAGSMDDRELHGFVNKFRSVVSQIAREAEEAIEITESGSTGPDSNSFNMEPQLPSASIGYNEFGGAEKSVRIVNGFVRRMPTIESIGSRELGSRHSMTSNLDQDETDAISYAESMN